MKWGYLILFYFKDYIIMSIINLFIPFIFSTDWTISDAIKLFYILKTL